MSKPAQILLPMVYVGYQLVRLAVAWFVIVMSRPQPKWLDVKRLVRR